MVYIYHLLGRIPQIGITTTGYWVEYQQKRENPSSIKMNISRINSLGKEGIITTFLLGRIPNMKNIRRPLR